MKTKLIPAYEYSEYDLWLMPQKGWLGGAVVETPDGRRHPVFFYDPVRLGQDLESGIWQGKPYIGEKGMIVLAEVTLEAAAQAVESLFAEGFFDRED